MEFAIDMMGKLTSEPDVYDTACLLAADTSTDVPDEDEDDRDENDEPPALMNLDELDDDLDLPTDEGVTGDSPAEVTILVDIDIRGASEVVGGSSVTEVLGRTQGLRKTGGV